MSGPDGRAVHVKRAAVVVDVFVSSTTIGYVGRPAFSRSRRASHESGRHVAKLLTQPHPPLVNVPVATVIQKAREISSRLREARRRLSFLWPRP
jgi:hypothetical protein